LPPIDGTNTDKKVCPEYLTKFGLTLDEAKAWLEQEPNYVPSDESKQREESDGEVTEPAPTTFLF